jgi:hypothetical protein
MPAKLCWSPAMTRLTWWTVLTLALGTAASAPALAGGSPYPIHIEHQRGRTVTILHTPVGARAVAVVRRTRVVKTVRAKPKAAVVRKVKRRVVVRRYRYAGIAGGCREGGFATRVVAGVAVRLQREVCHNVQPHDTAPWMRVKW